MATKGIKTRAFDITPAQAERLKNLRAAHNAIVQQAAGIETRMLDTALTVAAGNGVSFEQLDGWTCDLSEDGTQLVFTAPRK